MRPIFKESKPHTDKLILELCEDIKIVDAQETDGLVALALSMCEMDCKICGFYGHCASACWVNLELYHQTKPYREAFQAYRTYRTNLKYAKSPPKSGSSMVTRTRNLRLTETPL